MTKLFCVSLLALCAAACGGASQTPAATPSAAADSGLKPFGESKIGDRQKCVVSGEEFTVSESSPKVELDGKTYYFCCSGCAKKFKDDPKAFLPKTGA
jgi:YHS domain-containing protein